MGSAALRAPLCSRAMNFSEVASPESAVRRVTGGRAIADRTGEHRPERPDHGAVAPAESSGASTCTHTIFEQPWWLEAVAPGRWGEAIVRRGDEVFARLPFVMKHRLGMTVLTQPPLTPSLGPWIRETPGKYAKQLENEKDLMSDLIDELPPFDAFRQSFCPAVTNWLPFYWAGFEATTRYTYRIPDISDLDAVWNDLAANVRRHVRKAEKELALRTDLGVDVLLELNRQIFERQGLPAPYSGQLLRRLDRACAEREANALLFAVDTKDRVQAAAFVVHDGDVSYLLTSGVDTELRGSGAQSFLTWAAIRHAAGVSRSFDFAGSMLESVERFNRSFGAHQRPYLFVRRTRSHVKPLLMAQDRARALALTARRAMRERQSRASDTGSGST
jgi:hypothetical protein